MGKMSHKTLRKNGVKISGGESSLDAIRNGIPHWIHHTKEDPTSVTGVIYLPECDCSECGYTSTMEKPVCPHCGAKMEKF